MPRRPGITFETETPSVPDSLPRMDVAGFVGFATRGPIDRPVPVEDVDRFRDVFGPPLEMVREVETGRTRTAHLHRAVEAFFRNGGRRCWVVRVANPRDAASSPKPVRRTTFPVPGLVSADTGRPQTVRARCYGATFDDLRVGTVLHRRLLPPPSAFSVRSENGDDSEADSGLTLSWAVEKPDLPAEGDLTSGDLLRLRMVEQEDDRFSKETALVAYAPLISQTTWKQNGTVRSLSDGGRNGRAVTVRTGPVHVFKWVPDQLALSTERLDNTDASIPETRCVDVDVKVQDSSGLSVELPGAALVRHIGDWYEKEDLPRFRLIVDSSKIPAIGGSAELESRYVHVFDSSGDRFGYLHLGRARHSGDSNVEYDVRDALWTTSTEEAKRLASSGDAPDVTVEQIDFDLLAWRDQELRRRLDRLGFAESHPRAWTDLPVDDEVFELDHGEAVSPEPGTLRAEVFDPRFPLASQESTGVEDSGVFVPLGMTNRPDWTRTRGRISSLAEHSRLEKERVSTFSPQVFLDGDLAGTRTSTLGQKADDKIYLRDEPTSGLHSLWSISEVTLLAVPDAVHRGWRKRVEVDPQAATMVSFQNVEVRTDAETPYVRLSWKIDGPNEERAEVGDNPRVQVQEATEPTFESPVDRYRGTDASIERFVEAVPKTLYFRVRSIGKDVPGGWSETRRVNVPDPAFTACTKRRPDVPDVELHTEEDGRWWLRWESPGNSEETDLKESETSEIKYEVQVDTLPTFDTAESVVGRPEEDHGGTFPVVTVHSESTDTDDEETEFLQHDLGTPATTPAVRYTRLRVRRTNGEEALYSPWSRTITIEHALEQKRPLISKEDYNNPDSDTPGGGRSGLYDVHRAMLRFAAARKDVLSVLSLPESDQVDEARRHATRLRTPGAVLETQEENSLSFGALYYPWLLSPVEDGRQLVPTPPGAAACGTIADRTLRDGAWVAPANQSLASTQSVVPPIAADEPADLNARNVNVFAEGPGGIRTLTAATLARNSDLEPISTRRLLSLVRRLALREGPELVFENNTPLLRRRIAEQFDDLLRRLFERGAFAGTRPSEGYRVVTGSSVNPPEEVERGRLVVELRIAPSRPLKFLTVRLVQRGDGTTVAGEGTAV